MNTFSKYFTDQETFRSYFYYNPETGLLYKQTERNYHLGYIGNSGYLKYSWNQKWYYIHRIIWVYVNGDIPNDYQIDHINGNKLDNCITNLRLATSSENSMNTRVSNRNKSGIKGVSWNEAMNKWRAQIGINKKLIHLGYYDSMIYAEIAVKEARLKYHKEFANQG